jgi:hypothetical protein
MVLSLVFGGGFLIFGKVAEIEKILGHFTNRPRSYVLRLRNLLLGITGHPHIEDAEAVGMPQ